MNWKLILGVGFWWVLDVAIIVVALASVRAWVWKPMLDYFDLNKESIR